MQDDNDYVCLGGYGNDFGEQRWGYFNRALER